MTSKIKIISICVFIFVSCFFSSSSVSAVALPPVQTNPATNIQNTSATLNGNLFDLGGYGPASVWFQWGIDTNYGNNTSYISQNYTGNFSQQIFNLSPNQTFHYRAASQNSYGTFYGQDMIFTTISGNYYNTYNNVLLSASKTARNLSSGNLIWSSFINASPLDVLQFSITVQASGNQSAHNVYIRDVFPANLFYYNNLTVDGAPLYGNITQGINIGNISSGQTKTIMYQGQVASAANFSYGQTALVNSALISSSETSNATASASIYVTKSGLLGATNVPTGLTNNFLTDSFFLPLLFIILAMWLWKYGRRCL
ncbi:MAG: hypothetical protein HY219_02655 [Candidatus Staskawiczbacteria bacterium]|nr:hypothetical protein [Candidatus Staskawiczbacteria bacterium]